MSAAPVQDTRPRVLIASERPAARERLRGALAGHAICVEAGDPDEAIVVAARSRPNACLLDLQPTRRAIRAAGAIAAGAPGSHPVVLASRVDPDEMIAAMLAGASGYLPRAIDPGRLPDVVRGVLRGEAAVPRWLVGRLAEALCESREPAHLEVGARGPVRLTAREAEVVQGLRRGSSTRELAEQLGISSVTVRRHVSALHQKLGTASRDELSRLLLDGVGAS